MSTAFRKGAGMGVGLGLVLVAALALSLALAPAGSAQEGDEGSGDESPDATQPDDAPAREPLTDEERACLEENGAQLPELDEDGNPIRPERPDPSERPEPGSEEFEQKRAEMQERREAFRSAAEACGIELPEHGPRRPGCRHPLPGGETPDGTDDDAPAEGSSIGDAFLAA